MATMTKTKLQNFIDGEFVDAADGATEEVTNPANGEVIAEMPLSSEEDVNRAVAAAKGAFPEWSVTPPGERAAALLKLADLIEEHAVELPADDGRLEDRPGAGGGLHDRAEAGRDHADLDDQARRAGRPGAAKRRVQRDHRLRPAGRVVARDAPGHRDGLAHRLARDGEVDREGGVGLAQARAPRAGRQGARDRVRRRGHGGGDGDDRGDRALQRGPGLHRRDARARGVEGV